MSKIVLLYNLNHHEFEYETEFDSEITIEHLKHSISQRHEVILVEAEKDFSWISKIRTLNPDLVFNICEGFYGPARESVYGAILEQLSYNYSGPDSTNLLVCHNKILVKKILEGYVTVPFGYSIRNIEDLDLINSISFPVIVKLNSEGSSIGINRKSVVWNQNELFNQVQWIQKKYGRNIIIEEYIQGQDLSMIYVEGIGAMGPCVVESDSELYDYEMKTIKDKSVRIYEATGEYKDLNSTVLKIAKKLDIKGYAKMDFRVHEGIYYLIEVNSQVSFHPEGEFIVCAKKSGYEFQDIVNYIIDYAISKKIKINSFGIGEDVK